LDNLMKTVLSTSVTGTVASLVTTAILALLAKAEGKRAFQPTNATSHWLHGEKAGAMEQADLAHTGIGYLTHHASAVFWAAPFEAWLARNHPRSPLMMLRDASVAAALAALVDYGLMPKRLTPGWESVLSKRAMAMGFVALALGLAAGGLISQEIRRRSPNRRIRSWPRS
jgi:hypothetical protein